MVRLGVMIEAQEGLTWQRWARIIETAENNQFDSLWRSDHLFSVMGISDRDQLSLWPSMTLVAARDSKLEFGALVSPTTFRNPVMLAKDSVALDNLSGGRFWLGIGAGWNEREHAAFGYPLPPLKQRMDRLEEAIEVIKLLWSGDKVSYAGEQFQLNDAQMRPVPTSPSGVPMMIGGSGERRTLRMVARFADEWNATASSLDEYRHKVEVLERHCAEIGRDSSEIKRSLMLGHIIGVDEADLQQRAERVQQIIPSLQGLSISELLERLRVRGWLVGTPDVIIGDIRALAQVGVSRIMLQTHDQEDMSALELFASAVMPQVESLSAPDRPA
jgi:F420-dependent oxidoreductase-like protein